MNYPDGSEALIGDAVLLEHGKTPGTVVAVVEHDRVDEFNVDKPGLMISAASAGLVYVPASAFGDQGLRFQSRGSKTTLRWNAS